MPLYSTRSATIAAGLIAVLACSNDPTPTAPPTGPGEPLFITNGTPTGTAYGSVGAILVDEDVDGIPDFFACTGSLISETVFLTAAHCIFPDAGLYVSFAPDVSPLPTDLIEATAAFAHLDFVDKDFRSPDVGVLILPPGATAGIQPFELAPQGYLDDLKVVHAFAIIVGYGYESVLPGPVNYTYDGLRKVARAPVARVRPETLGLLNNTIATGEGGSCFGDSGSPVFLESDPNLIVGVTSYGNDRKCNSITASYRIDIAPAREFLNDFVTLP